MPLGDPGSSPGRSGEEKESVKPEFGLYLLAVGNYRLSEEMLLISN